MIKKIENKKQKHTHTQKLSCSSKTVIAKILGCCENDVRFFNQHLFPKKKKELK